MAWIRRAGFGKPAGGLSSLSANLERMWKGLTMKQEEVLVGALVSSARADMGRGVRREDILESLSRLIDAELYHRVRERL